MVYGRKTFELMVPFWPDVAKNPAGYDKGMIEFAQSFVSIPKKTVFSRTLEKADGRNTKIVRTHLEDEILKLKQEPGKNILTGGVEIPSQLMKLGLMTK